MRQTLGLLHLDQRREELADIIGEFQVTFSVFPECRAFAESEALREFLGEVI
jgi:hypothetical protein